MRDMTLSIIIEDGKICLWEKKRWFAKWILNGMWWKVDPGENIAQAMVREIKEEINIDVKESDLQKVWLIHFTIATDPDNNAHIHLYKVNNYSGTPIEIEEIRPFWCNLDAIPYDKMWDDDKIWLPRILNWETDIEYEFKFNTMEEWIESYTCIK